MTSASTYTDEIDLATILGGVTRARGRKKGVQGFLSVDPLTSYYPELTPYQFASNSPISGIDLDGLEYLRAEDALIEMRMGYAYLKIANQSSVTQDMYADAEFAAWTDPNGQQRQGTTFDTRIKGRRFETPKALQRKLPPRTAKMLETQTKKYPEYNRHFKRGNKAIARKTGRVPGSSRGTGRAKNGGAAVDAGQGLVASGKLWRVSKDFLNARDQYDEFGKLAVRNIQTSINEGLVIPESISGSSEMSDLTNFIVSGELLYNDPNSENGRLIIEVAKSVMIEHNIPDRSESNQETPRP